MSQLSFNPEVQGFIIYASFLGKMGFLCYTKELFSNTMNSLCACADLDYTDLQLQSAIYGFEFIFPIVKLTK
jgi:hypothetical protein